MRISDWSSDVCSSDLPFSQWWRALFGGAGEGRHAHAIEIEDVRQTAERDPTADAEGRIDDFGIAECGVHLRPEGFFFVHRFGRRPAPFCIFCMNNRTSVVYGQVV